MKRKVFGVAFLCLTLTLVSVAFGACTRKKPCNNGHTYGEWVVDTPATCTADGERSRTCSVCSHEDTQAISALGHATVGHEPQAATCTAVGWNAYDKCSRCDYTTKVEIPALGHDYSTEFTIDRQATCTEDGSKSKHCSRCESKTDVTVIDKLGHDTVDHEAKAATCTAVGWNAYDTCSRCDYTTKVEIPALGHAYGDWSETPATCTEDGEKTRICSACSDVETQTLPATGHTYTNCYDFNDQIHWKTCDDCGQASEETTAHAYNNEDTCSACKVRLLGTQGLAYIKNDDDASYTVSGIGQATDTNIFITYWHDNLPVTAIAEGAFKNCAQITSIRIPNSVTSIGGEAFNGCGSLTSAIIPDTVAHVGNYVFNSCGSLHYNAYDNALYLGNNDNPYVLLVKAKNMSINACAINNRTKIICCAAFDGCANLTSIETPNGVTTIGPGAFYHCYALKSITIPSSVTSIGGNAFYQGYALTSIKYGGTKAQWKAITRGDNWNYDTGNYTVTCTDGMLSKSESEQ